MKRVILGLFVAGTFLVSCGGPSPESTVEGTVKIAEDINAEEESRLDAKMDAWKDLLELKDEWVKEQDEILKDYGTHKDPETMSKLRKAVGQNDEKAIEVWMNYMVAKHEKDKKAEKIKEGMEKSEKYKELEWALETSTTLLGILHNGEKAKDFKADKTKLETELDRLDGVAKANEDKRYTEFKKWFDSDYKGDKEGMKDFNPFQKASKK